MNLYQYVLENEALTADLKASGYSASELFPVSENQKLIHAYHDRAVEIKKALTAIVASESSIDGSAAARLMEDYHHIASRLDIIDDGELHVMPGQNFKSFLLYLLAQDCRYPLYPTTVLGVRVDYLDRDQMQAITIGERTVPVLVKRNYVGSATITGNTVTREQAREILNSMLGNPDKIELDLTVYAETDAESAPDVVLDKRITYAADGDVLTVFVSGQCVYEDFGGIINSDSVALNMI